MLVEREGKIVTREEIKGKLWLNDTVVDFAHSINATIKTSRSQFARGEVKLKGGKGVHGNRA